METTRPSRWRRFWGFVREHPVTVGVLVAGTITGAVVAYYLPVGREGLSPVVKILGGAVLGAWVAMFPLGFRLFD